MPFISASAISPYNSIRGGAEGVDPNAKDYFDRVSLNGGLLTNLEKSAINTLVVDLKEYDIWTKIKAAYPMVGSSAAACAVNLKSSSFKGTFTSGWTFAATGATPNGTSAYMDTGFIPSTNFDGDNDVSVGIYMRDIDGDSNKGFFGSANQSGFNNGTYIVVIFSDDVSYNRAASSEPLIFDNLRTNNGMYVVSRVSSSQFEMYYDGSIVKTQIAESTGRTSNTIWLGAVNAGGVVQYGGGETAFASIGNGLSDEEAANYNTVVQKFQTTLSRNV